MRGRVPGDFFPWFLVMEKPQPVVAATAGMTRGEHYGSEVDHEKNAGAGSGGQEAERVVEGVLHGFRSTGNVGMIAGGGWTANLWLAGLDGQRLPSAYSDAGASE